MLCINALFNPRKSAFSIQIIIKPRTNTTNKNEYQNKLSTTKKHQRQVLHLQQQKNQQEQDQIKDRHWAQIEQKQKAQSKQK